MTSPALLGETSSVEILTVFRLFNQEEGFEENVFGLTEPSSNPEVIDIVANNVSDLSNISTSTGETIHGMNYSVLGWRSKIPANLEGGSFSFLLSADRRT